jgi:hypothetical protein
MARTFVYSDNLAARVEIGQEPSGDGEYWALCVGHATLTSLVADTHDMWSFEDTAQVAESHADSCRKCADDACTTPRPHDAGHRCRKP